jgi:hypothetical protein
LWQSAGGTNAEHIGQEWMAAFACGFYAKKAHCSFLGSVW